MSTSRERAEVEGVAIERVGVPGGRWPWYDIEVDGKKIGSVKRTMSATDDRLAPDGRSDGWLAAGRVLETRAEAESAIVQHARRFGHLAEPSVTRAEGGRRDIDLAETRDAYAALPEFSRSCFDWLMETGLYAEPGFSDVDAEQIARGVGASVEQVKGALSRLHSAGLTWTYDDGPYETIYAYAHEAGYKLADLRAEEPVTVGDVLPFFTLPEERGWEEYETITVKVETRPAVERADLWAYEGSRERKLEALADALMLEMKVATGLDVRVTVSDEDVEVYKVESEGQ